MSIRYDMRIVAPDRTPLGTLATRGTWQATRTVNAVGAFSMMLPWSAIDRSWLQKDSQITIWRAIDQQHWQITDQTRWFITGIESNTANQTYTITGVDSQDLLNRRIIAYAADTAQSKKSGNADNLIKAFVRENCGSLAPVARQYPSIFSVAPDASLAPSVEKAAAWQELLDTLQDLVAISRDLGTYLAFDVVALPNNSFELQTFIGQRGADRRDLLIGTAYRNITNAVYTIDYAPERNVVYAGGEGEGTLRLIGTATDTQRATQSPFARRELFYNATQCDTQSQVTTEARAQLVQNRPKVRFEGSFVDGVNLRYGRDVSFGDLVRVALDNGYLDCRLETVTIGETQEGQHICDVVLKGEADVL